MTNEPKCPKGCDPEHVVGIEIPEVYDGVLFWECRACAARWHRWPAGTRLWVAAESSVKRAEQSGN